MKNTNKNKNTTKLPSSLRTAFIRFARKHAKLNHSVAAPLPTKSNDFAGTPNKVKRDSVFTVLSLWRLPLPSAAP